ncbi:hypothetical protein ACH5RR_002723 [Cinchona calisaya]|uniref:Uncharacterized protein n=1 Tax=Cinchona calisaya TaxID=153742 RepID=A0ABD3ASR6_9GENT
MESLAFTVRRQRPEMVRPAKSTLLQCKLLSSREKRPRDSHQRRTCTRSRLLLPIGWSSKERTWRETDGGLHRRRCFFSLKQMPMLHSKTSAIHLILHSLLRGAPL